MGVTRNLYGAPTQLTDYDGIGLNHSARFQYDGASRLTVATQGQMPQGDRPEYIFRYRFDGLQNMTDRAVTINRANTPPGLAKMFTGVYRHGERGQAPPAN